jgi:hypothetical protein
MRTVSDNNCKVPYSIGCKEDILLARGQAGIEYPLLLPMFQKGIMIAILVAYGIVYSAGLIVALCLRKAGCFRDHTGTTWSIPLRGGFLSGSESLQSSSCSQSESKSHFGGEVTTFGNLSAEGYGGNVKG